MHRNEVYYKLFQILDSAKKHGIPVQEIYEEFDWAMHRTYNTTPSAVITTAERISPIVCGIVTSNLSAVVEHLQRVIDMFSDVPTFEIPEVLIE